MSASPQPKSRYENWERLPKQGAMGVVYRAWDVKLRRYVVIKTIGDVRNSAALDHFRKEWEILANINHANIVDIYDIGEMEAEGQVKPFFVMPFLPGQTLEQLIAAQTLTVAQTVEIISQVCRGLQAAHDQGVIHRDVKPSNIFVIDEAGTVKIIDFGVAHLSDNAATMGLKGTPLYMSPEQVHRTTKLGPASDLFSLAVVTYEALTQRRPFQGSTQEEIFFKILNHVPPLVSEINPAAGTALSQVVHVGMAKRTQHRFGSAREFGEALQKALHNRPIERFDPKRAEPRIQKARRALEGGQFDFAGDVLGELEAEGHLHPEIRQLRRQMDQAVRERSIRQTLEGARHFVEEEEYALARQKVQQLLETSPGHPDAMAILAVIEEKWTGQQVIEWMRLAKEHLENQSFPQARQAAQSILSLRPTDSQALQLLSDVTRMEEQIARVRRESAELFQKAREAFARGDISAALSKAERVLDHDRQTPDKSAPDLAATHREFYNEVRSEHEAVRQAVIEVRRLLAEKDFQAAYEICDKFLARYPRDAQFRALRLDVDHKERQHISSYIAEIERQVNAESDLDRRVAILEKAAAEFPREEHFKKALPAVVELRDLVKSVVERAQQLEKRSHFAEALSQWETLRTIHPAYPDLEAQVARLTECRDKQQREEARQRRLSHVRRLTEMSSFDEAIRASEAALAEFPGDEELAAAGKHASERRKTAVETDRLLKEGNDLITRGDFDPGVAKLRQAFELDHQNDGTRMVLVNTLLKRATTLQHTEPFRASELVEEILKIDPAHRGAAELQVSLAEKRRELTIGGIIARAREMQEKGDASAARNELATGLDQYPNDPLLTQSLRVLAEPPKPAPGANTPAPKAEDTQLFPPPPLPPEPTQTAPVPPPVYYPPVWKIAAVVVGAVAILALPWWYFTREKKALPDVPKGPNIVQLEVRPANPSARVYLDGQLMQGTVLDLKPRDQEYIIEARQPGYRSVPERVKVGPETKQLTPLALHLEPYRTRLALETGMRAIYQGKDVAGEVELPAGTHSVDLTSEGSALNLKIEADIGKHATVTPTAKDISSFAIVTALGEDAEVHMWPAAAAVALDGQPVTPVSQKMTLPKLTPGDHELMLGNRTIKFKSGEAPTVTVQAVAPGNFGWLVLLVNEDGATVSLTGPTGVKPQAVKDRKVVFGNLRPGKYEIEITKDGFEPLKEPIDIVRLQNAPNRQYTLKPQVAAPVLIITEGMPNTQVYLEDKLLGTVDGGRNLRVSNLPTGRRTFRLQYAAPDIYDPKFVTKDISMGEQVRLTAEELALVKIRGIHVQNEEVPGTRFRYRVKGATAWTDASGAMIRVTQAGTYEVERLINNVRRGFKEISVTDSVVATQIPVTEEAKPIKEPPVQTRSLIEFDPPQGRIRDGWTDISSSRMNGRIESGQFEFQVQLRGGVLGVGKKAAKWSFSSRDGKCVEFEMEADRFGVGVCGQKMTMQPTKATKAQIYRVRITLTGGNVIHAISGGEPANWIEQDRRSLPTPPVEFRFGDGNVRDFRFRGLLAP